MPKGKRTGRLVLILIACILLSVFIASSIINVQKSQEGLSTPTAAQILDYATGYLKDSVSAELGRKLDCSGYTKRVFGNFDISISPSARIQYKTSKLVDRNELKAGNLVFFNTSGQGISHVGISIDTALFIHSPGKGRYVQIDSLTNNYWSHRFVAAGKIELEKERELNVN